MRVTITVEHKGTKFAGGHEFKSGEVMNPKIVSAIMRGLQKTTLRKMADMGVVAEDQVHRIELEEQIGKL